MEENSETSAASDTMPKFVDSMQVCAAVHPFYASDRLHTRQIAARIIALYRDALLEDERILSASLQQFVHFFVAHPNLSRPRITLTPDGTLRVRWIQGPEDFTAIEFTGKFLKVMVGTPVDDTTHKDKERA